MKKLVVLSIGLLLPLIAWGATTPYNIKISTQFTPRHLYFMSPTGRDSNSGTDTAHPWATPNHALMCSDVIVAAPGDYSGIKFDNNWGTVSNCPSPAGNGIDGNGGIYFAILLCGGSDLEACYSNGRQWQVNKSNWSVQGWKVSTNSSFLRAFNMGCGGFLHHQAFINDIAFNASSGFHTDDCGKGSRNGIDYVAVIGSIAQNASRNDSYCEAAIDAVNPAAWDLADGTHIFIHGNFVWYSQQTNCSSMDSEGIMFDAWNSTHTNSFTGVISNNMIWRSMRFCINLFPNGSVTISPTFLVYNNTCFSDETNTFHDSADSAINDAVRLNWTVKIQKNIVLVDHPTGGTYPVFAMSCDLGNPNLTCGGIGNENILMAQATSCPSGQCYATMYPYSLIYWNGTRQSASNNIITDPQFTNTAHLLAHYTSQNPNCSGFEIVTQCMGWDAKTGTLTTPSVISDLTANCARCSGKGYQRPDMTCAANADFPAWLKGIVYLHWTGKIIEQRAGLVSMPCAM
jgi:hypothetical protein